MSNFLSLPQGVCQDITLKQPPLVYTSSLRTGEIKGKSSMDDKKGHKKIIIKFNYIFACVINLILCTGNEEVWGCISNTKSLKLIGEFKWKKYVSKPDQFLVRSFSYL